jgi:hypothetical protein
MTSRKVAVFFPNRMTRHKYKPHFANGRNQFILDEGGKRVPKSKKKSSRSVKKTKRQKAVANSKPLGQTRDTAKRTVAKRKTAIKRKAKNVNQARRKLAQAETALTLEQTPDTTPE